MMNVAPNFEQVIVEGIKGLSQCVTDIMAIVLYLSKRKLPMRVKQLFQSADLGLSSITIPAFVAVEISFLSAKGRIDVSLADLQQHINRYPSYRFEPLIMDVIEASLPMTDIPELHDRLIAATGRLFSIPVITNDPDITPSAFVDVV